MSECEGFNVPLDT